MSKYLIDEMGNKFEGMTKDEILETIGAGELKQNVFTSTIFYKNEDVTFEYCGVKPSDEYITKLLNVSMNFSLSLSASEISELLALGEFKLHVFLCETEVYITNGHCDVINIYNSQLGYRNLYVNKNKNVYYMKANSPINDIYHCTKAEYDSIAKDPNTIYVVEDEEYTVESTKNVSESIGNYPIREIFANYDSTNKYLRNGMVKSATHADHAGYAEEANIAASATNATHADSADRCHEAQDADNATNAVTSEKTKELLSKNFKSWASGLTIPTDSEVEVLNVNFRDGKGHLLMCNFDVTVNSTTQHISAIIFVRSISTSAIQYYTCIPNGQYGIINIAVRPQTDGLYMQNATSGSTLKLMSIETIDIDEQ